LNLFFETSIIFTVSNSKFITRSEIHDISIESGFTLSLFTVSLVPRRRWVDNIKMDLREIGLHGMDWIKLAKDRDQWRALVKTVMKLRVP
jgi:hypothetical protein